MPVHIDLVSPFLLQLLIVSQVLTDGLASNPDNLQLIWRRAMVYNDARRHQESLDTLDIVASREYSSRVLVARARSLRNLRRGSEAEAVLAACLRDFPEEEQCKTMATNNLDIEDRLVFFEAYYDPGMPIPQVSSSQQRS